MRRILHLYAQKPFLLDLTIALVLLPLFCHFVVALHSKRTIAELVFMKAYWIPMAISYGCGLVVMAYIRWHNSVLDQRYGIDDNWDLRASRQFKWNILPSVAFVTLVIAAYFAFYNESIFRRGYLRRDVFLVWMGVILLVLIYYVQNKHRYLWKKQREQKEYDRLMAEEAAQSASAATPEMEPAEAKTMIWVLHPKNRRDAIHMPLHAIALIDRHNGTTTVSTWDGQRFEWPMPSLKMKAFVLAHGFTWFGQHYALLHATIETSEGVGQQGRRLLLKPDIVINKEKQVFRARRDGQLRTYLLFHKNIAKEVGDWVDAQNKKGRPGLERP